MSTPSPGGIKITHGDAKRAGFCARGQRQWFAARGLNYIDFVQNGIDVEIVRPIGDYYATLLIEQAEARVGRD